MLTRAKEISLKIVSWNLKTFKGKAADAALELGALGPDVICFQGLTLTLWNELQSALREQDYFAFQAEIPADPNAVFPAFASLNPIEVSVATQLEDLPVALLTVTGGVCILNADAADLQNEKQFLAQTRSILGSLKTSNEMSTLVCGAFASQGQRLVNEGWIDIFSANRLPNLNGIIDRIGIRKGWTQQRMLASQQAKRGLISIVRHKSSFSVSPIITVEIKQKQKTGDGLSLYEIAALVDLALG